MVGFRYEIVVRLDEKSDGWPAATDLPLLRQLRLTLSWSWFGTLLNFFKGCTTGNLFNFLWMFLNLKGQKLWQFWGPFFKVSVISPTQFEGKLSNCYQRTLIKNFCNIGLEQGSHKVGHWTDHGMYGMSKWWGSIQSYFCQLNQVGLKKRLWRFSSMNNKDVSDLKFTLWLTLSFLACSSVKVMTGSAPVVS